MTPTAFAMATRFALPVRGSSTSTSNTLTKQKCEQKGGEPSSRIRRTRLSGAIDYRDETAPHHIPYIPCMQEPRGYRNRCIPTRGPRLSACLEAVQKLIQVKARNWHPIHSCFGGRLALTRCSDKCNSTMLLYWTTAVAHVSNGIWWGTTTQ